MSKIDAMIQELCPDGVEYRSVKELCERISSGRCKSKKDEGQYKVYGSTGIIGFTDFYAYEGEKILVGRVGSAGFTYLVRGQYDVSDNTLILTPRSENLLKYIYYQLVNMDLRRLARGSAQPLVTAGDIGRVVIPVPPLEIQREIVRVLDAFTELTTELTTELSRRKRQYEYYREKLLSFDPGVASVVTLGDICKRVVSGGTPKAGVVEYYGGDIPWLRTQEVDWNDIYDVSIKITEEGLRNSSAKWIPKNCVIVAMYGATAGKVAINKIELTTNQACCNLEIDPTKALYRYVYHWLCKSYLKLKSLGQGTQSNLNAQMIKDFPIPLPSLRTQERLVRVLDNFDAICQDLEIGLPAEISARKKQYEYYRDQLLNFAQFGVLTQTNKQTNKQTTRR